MRVFRFLAGVLIIAAALWIIIGEQITGASSNAVVNARLTTVRAPIAGQLDIPFRAFGSSIANGEAIGTITDPLADAVRLHDLQLERSFQLATIRLLTAQMGQAESEIAELETRVNDYRQFRQAENEQIILRSGERVQLLGGDSQASADTDAAPDLALSEEKETLGVARVAGSAIASDVFLGDGYNDAPATEVRLFQIRAQRADLQARLQEANDRLGALDARLEQEQARVNALRSAVLVSPDDGVVWEVLADSGETVQRGQDVMRLMKCDSALVTLSVAVHIYNDLRVGQAAKFRLDGDRTVYDATITRIAGSGAASIYENLAVAPSQKHLEQYDVTIVAPALRENVDLRCTVGQTGRVFFENRPLDRLRDWFN